MDLSLPMVKLIFYFILTLTLRKLMLLNAILYTFENCCSYYYFLIIEDCPCLFVAENLMEQVYRMTYNCAFLFKKTLAETGQTVLAEYVPVKVRELPLVEESYQPDNRLLVYRRSMSPC